VIDLILEGFKSKNHREAVAAGYAFTKITGFDVESDKRVTLPPEDGHEPDEIEKEFLDDGFLPDFDLAQGHWQKAKDIFAKGTCWCRGHDFTQLKTDLTTEQTDMVSYSENLLRIVFAGHARNQLTDIKRFRPEEMIGLSGWSNAKWSTNV